MWPLVIWRQIRRVGRTAPVVPLYGVSNEHVQRLRRRVEFNGAQNVLMALPAAELLAACFETLHLSTLVVPLMPLTLGPASIDWYRLGMSAILQLPHNAAVLLFAFFSECPVLLVDVNKKEASADAEVVDNWKKGGWLSRLLALLVTRYRFIMSAVLILQWLSLCCEVLWLWLSPKHWQASTALVLLHCVILFHCLQKIRSSR